MASINKAIIVGHLGRDPETRASTSGTAVASLTVATTRRYKQQDGMAAEETEWHRVSIFGRLAEIARDYLHKGSLVYIEGRIRTRKYAGKDGQERYVTEIIGETLQLLDRRGDTEGESARPAPMSREQQAEAYRAEQKAFNAAGGEDVPF